jgi:hypothetical protein
MEVLFLNFSGETKRTMKAVFRVVGVAADIRTEHPQKTRAERCTSKLTYGNAVY